MNAAYQETSDRNASWLNVGFLKFIDFDSILAKRNIRNYQEVKKKGKMASHMKMK